MIREVVAIDPSAAGGDSWVMEMDVAGVPVVVHPLNGRHAPYRVEVLRSTLANAETMERALEFAASAIEAKIRKAVNRRWLAQIAEGFDSPADG